MRSFHTDIDAIVALAPGCLLTRTADIAIVADGSILWDPALSQTFAMAGENLWNLIVSWTATPVECVLVDWDPPYASLVDDMRRHARAFDPNDVRRHIADIVINHLDGHIAYPVCGKRAFWRLPAQPHDADIESRIRATQALAGRWASQLAGAGFKDAANASVQDIVSLIYSISDPIRKRRLPISQSLIRRLHAARG